MTQIRTMPSGSTTQRVAKNQALQAYLGSVLGRPFEMTQAAIATVFQGLANSHVAAVQPLIPTASLEQMALASMHFNTPELTCQSHTPARFRQDHLAPAPPWPAAASASDPAC